ncbi:glycosyltransferase family protein [Terrirubrum flagellatum]|uniref:glycosyltransferase family protein n=1 Tax=Terrirubrum flagellatum TaxID=2895980 RepID=UPI003CC831F2
MYSHDTFGLGHLRRCRTIAHALVDNFKGVHVLIISGSQIAGAFDFKARVDFVKIPSVIKLYDGEYTSISQHIDIHETLEWRKEIIRSTAASFEPDLVIVDKEPLGLRGELLPTLNMLKAKGCRLVVGLRDVMDDAESLIAEWNARNVLRHMDALFDDIWIYGPEGFWNPLGGMSLPPDFERRFSYTGFLRRERMSTKPLGIEELPKDYILVTAGGGGDGAPLMRSILAAHALDPQLDQTFLFVLGPFMRKEEREEIHRAAAILPRVHVVDFHNRLEALLEGAKAVVSMAGYNTFCEILSLNKRALLVPRVAPREEQLIRATRAAEFGLVDMIMPEDAMKPEIMAARLRALIARPLPFDAGADDMLRGLERIRDLVKGYFVNSNRREVFLPPAAE